MMLPDDSYRPSAGYLLALGGGCLGLTFGSLPIGAVWEMSRGVDPYDAMSGPTTIVFAISYIPLFAVRLIFWPRSSPQLRALTRRLLTGFLIVSFLEAIAAAVFPAVYGATSASTIVILFAILAVLCQVGTVVWLVRYRRV